MLIDFEKWHGCENDFVVLWLSDHDGDVVLDSLKRQAAALCHRHSGIGADGILVLRTRQRGDLTPYGLTIINSDGSIARNCGNGLRCAALSVLKRHRELGDPRALPELLQLDVEGAPLVCRYTTGSSGGWPLVVVDMGVAQLDADVAWQDQALQALRTVATSIGMPELTQGAGVCAIGNPHIVIHSDQASRALLLQIGPALQTAAAWDGINVHLVRPATLHAKDQTRAANELGQGLSELHQVFVWERGAGETRACGSGACAVAALALASGLSPRDKWMAVDMPGGRLYVKQTDVADPVLLAGPGCFVFSGKLTL